MIRLEIGGLAVGVETTPSVREAIRARFAPFVVEEARPPSVLLTIDATDPFQPELELPEQAAITLDGARVALRLHDTHGEYRIDERRGRMLASGLGAFDSLLRAALSLTLPLDGALLLHGALVPSDDGRSAWAYVGDSGAGKSTVADAAGGVCDEQLVARPTEAGVRLSSTPYWGGRRLDADAHGLVCLGRNGPPAVRRLHGAEAVRRLLRHAIRYVSHPAVDRAQLALTAALCERVPVIDAVCPSGPAFLPFLFSALRDLERVAA